MCIWYSFYVIGLEILNNHKYLNKVKLVHRLCTSTDHHSCIHSLLTFRESVVRQDQIYLILLQVGAMAAAVEAFLSAVSGCGCTRSELSEVSSVDSTCIIDELFEIVLQVNDQIGTGMESNIIP
jgi:hypothetical protein